MSAETHATTLSAGFYIHFQTTKNDISKRLENFASGNTLETQFSALSSDIVKLRKDLIDATPYLPPYDRGKCEQQLKVLEESLSRYRIPKSKFTFKRKPANTLPSSTTPTPPIHSPSYQTPTSTSTTTNLTLSSHTSSLLTLSSLSHDAAFSQIPSSSDMTLTDLNTCIVDLFKSQPLSDPSVELKLTALHARDLRRVILMTPPVEGSVLLHNVHDSVIIVACHQFRMHDASNTVVLLHALSNPTIEGSHHIQFGEYPTALRDACATAKTFFTGTSKHTLVQDFDWIKPSPSPNWSVLDPSSELADNVVRLVHLRSGSDDVDVAGIVDQIMVHGEGNSKAI